MTGLAVLLAVSAEWGAGSRSLPVRCQTQQEAGLCMRVQAGNDTDVWPLVAVAHLKLAPFPQISIRQIGHVIATLNSYFYQA